VSELEHYMGAKWTVQIVGTFGLRRGISVLAGAEIGCRKARLLLAMLAVDQGHWLSTYRVAEVLWPGHAAGPRPARNVATLVSRLRRRFGPDLIEGGNTIYRLGGDVAVDLTNAAGLVSFAERAEDGNEALLAAEQALNILECADVLCGEPHAKFAEPAREHRVMLLRRARLAAAHRALQAGEMDVARDAAERAAAADALDEAAFRTLMMVHAASGEPARALIAYQRLRSSLADELGAHPAAATQELHVEILRGRSPVPHGR
jgi:DNA-binding SARP family transcriptional activator